MSGGHAQSKAHRALRARLMPIWAAEDAPCCRCGKPIRYDLDGRHSWGPTLDLLIPHAHGGPMTADNAGPAHRKCNLRHGSHVGNRALGLGPGSRGGNPATYRPRRRRAAQTPEHPPRPTIQTMQRNNGEAVYPDAFPRTPRQVIVHSLPNGHQTAPTNTNMHPNVPISGEWVDGRERELWGLRPRPPEGTWPRLMSPVHPDAVGTFGPEMLAWAAARPGMHPKRSAGWRWWQELAAYRALEHDADGRLLHSAIALTTSRQVGKALAADTPVLTADRGWTSMGDLVAGDRVFAPDGSPTVVTAAHPVRMPVGGLWRVTLTDGRWLDADGEHLWEVFDRGGARRVMTTLDLLDAGLVRDRTTVLDGKVYASHEYRFRVSDQSAVDLPDRAVPLDPWLLGYWLGNGTSCRAEVCASTADVGHVADRVAAAGAHILQCSPANASGTATIVSISTQPTRAVRLPNVDGAVAYSDSLTARLRDLGVLDDKHIPEVYLAAGHGQRLELLRGLMDSDGHAPKAGTVLELCFTNQRLAMDAVALMRSLGYQPRWSESEARIGGRYISQRWRIRFSVPEGMPIPFALPRKVDRVRRTAWRKRPSVASIERVPDREVRCITVGRPDGMFLAGHELVPTHNSWLLRGICGWRLSLAERLGEVQTVVHAADKLPHAFAVWKWAGMWAKQQPALTVRWANGEQRITTPDGSEWGIHAATDGLGASLSVSLGLVDEAWNVSLGVVDNGLVPTMAEAEQAQLWLVSTAGGEDEESAVPVSPLLPSYRDVALTGGEVLLLEWSAPREADIDDPTTWRLASPHWDERRAHVVGVARRRATTAKGVEAFRRQWLNQWPEGRVRREPPLVDATVWAEAGRVDVVRPVSRLVVGLSCEEPGRWPVVAAGRVGDTSAVLVWLVGMAGSMDEAVSLAAGVASGGGAVLLVPSHGLRDQVPRVAGTGSRFHLNEGDAASAAAMVHEWLAGGLLVHDPADVALTAAVGALPERRRPRTWDAGIMALVAGWWAHKQRPRSSVV